MILRSLEIKLMKLLGNFFIFPELSLFLLQILVFVSRMLVHLWLRSPVGAARIFATFVVFTHLGEVAHAAGHDPYPNAGAAGPSVPAAPPLPQRRAGARFPTILLPPEPNEPPQSGVGRSATTPPEPKTSTACLEVVKALLNGAARGCTGSWCTGIWDELKNCCSPSSCCDEWID